MGLTIFNHTGILCIIALGGLMLGLETTSMAVFLASDTFMDYFDYPGPLIQGIIGGANPAAAFFGCWLAGYLSDAYGRIRCIQLASLLWCLGSIVSVFSGELWALIGGRAIKGLSVGCFSPVLSVYLFEILPQAKRGMGSSVIQWCLTWGIMLMFYLCFLCESSFDDDMAFRVAWAVESSPGLFLFICSFFLPESPKWLASSGRMEESYQVSQKLDPPPINSEQRAESGHEEQEQEAGVVRDGETASTRQLSMIEGVIGRFEGEAKTCTYGDLFRSGLRSHLFAGILTQSVVQLSGIGVLMYYLVFICEMIGMQGDTKIMAASIQYVINVLFTIPPLLCIDKVRRKDVLVYATTCLGLCIAAIGAIMGIYGHAVPPIGGNESVVWEVTGTAGSWTLALCFLFVAIFASTISCVAWLYTNEIFPARAKAKGSAICMAVSWTWSFLLTFLAPLSLSSIKWATFVVFGVCGLVGALVMGLWFPETLGKQEHEIELIFGPPRRSVDDDIESKIESQNDRIVVVDNEKIEDESNTVRSHGTTPRASMAAIRSTANVSPMRSGSPSRATPSPAKSRQSTMRLSLDGTNLRLAPPVSTTTESSAELAQAVSMRVSSSLSPSPARSFTAQSSPFLKKMGAPFEMSDSDQEHSGRLDSDNDHHQQPKQGDENHTQLDKGTADDKPGEALTPDGYYLLSTADSPFLSGYQ